MRANALTLLIAGVLIAPASASAQASAPSQPAIVQKLMACRKIEATTERLACYDAVTQAFDQAQASGDIVVVDREQAEKVRRQAFGFTLPSLSLFDRPAKPADKAEGKTEGKTQEKAEARDTNDRLSTTLKRATRRGDGKWVFELEDGAIWIQTDNEPLPRGAKAGDSIEIRRAAMGSFFVNVDGQRAIRAVRTR